MRYKDTQYMELSELLKKERRHGDIEFVASVVGCAPVTVKCFLAPKESKRHRNIDSPTGKKVLSAFKMLFDQRQELKKLHSKSVA